MHINGTKCPQFPMMCIPLIIYLFNVGKDSHVLLEALFNDGLRYYWAGAINPPRAVAYLENCGELYPDKVLTLGGKLSESAVCTVIVPAIFQRAYLPVTCVRTPPSPRLQLEQH